MAEVSAGDRYDVAILGTGIGGTILGAILARHGARVLLLEQGVHPRFAIGESTIPETTVQLRLMAKRYDVPEIGYISNFHAVRSRVSSACGIKRNFTFVYHRPGEIARGDEMTQLPTWAPPFGPDVHYFRQDIDAYMLGVAVRYGAHVRQETRVREVAFTDDEVHLTSEKSGVFRARYVVDAGGMRAHVADQLGLRDKECPLRNHSRGLYTHLVGVAPFDNVGPTRREHGLPSPVCQGTLHHLFTGGWMWVIPFDNHPSSSSELCSVGLMLDPRVHPPTGEPPEVEFQSFVSRMPTVARQFVNARPIRPWTATGRIQYSSSTVAGDRYCLLPHAAAFVDPLFSSGLAITMNAINAMAWRLIDAVKDDDFSGERFRYVDEWVKRSFAYYDTLVSTSYQSFSSFEVWNAWHRTWMLGSLYGINGQVEILGRYERSGNKEEFKMLEEEPFRGVNSLDFDAYAGLFGRAAAIVQASNSPGVSPGSNVVSDLYANLRESGLVPKPWGIDSPERRCPGTFTLLPMLRLGAWAKFQSPESVRKHYFKTGRAMSILEDLASDGTGELGRSLGAAIGYLRDSVWSWNQEWAYKRREAPRV